MMRIHTPNNVLGSAQASTMFANRHASLFSPSMPDNQLPIGSDEGRVKLGKFTMAALSMAAIKRLGISIKIIRNGMKSRVNAGIVNRYGTGFRNKLLKSCNECIAMIILT